MMDDINVLSKIAQALLVDYTSVYFVDAVTRHYKWYSIDTGYKALKIEPEGEDFFKNVSRDARDVIYPDDMDMVISFLSEENLLQKIRTGAMNDITYRLIMDGKPVYHNMRLIKGVGEENDYFVVGVRNVDAQIQAEREKAAYNQIAESLANHYDTIYYVDIETDHYTEFSSTDRYKTMGIPIKGDDFFGESRRNINRVVHPEDRDRVTEVHTKENALNIMKNKSINTMTYKLIVGDEIVNVRNSMIWAKDRKHLIIGIENIDDEVEAARILREAEQKNQIFSQVAQSLAEHYETIFYVDVETDRYQEFSSDDIYSKLDVNLSGNDFFEDTKRNTAAIVHPDDREKMLKFLSKERLGKELKKGTVQTIDYRLVMEDGSDRYTRLSIVLSNDGTHAIFGVENIDEEVKKELKQKEIEKERLTYNQIALSLANRYIAIYYIDTETLHYTEFSCTNNDRELTVHVEGDDFFADFAEEVRTKVVPEDRGMFDLSLDMNKLNEIRENDDILQFTYRIFRNSAPVYMSYKGTWASDNRHFIVGISNIDYQKRKEKEFMQALLSAKEQAERDGLTGVKNMTAYQRMEDSLQQAMNHGEQEPFAIVVCDVNGLKQINDTYGHKAGDDYIREACTIVCSSFQHSPVFRIGGDEFCAVLKGDDFDNRNMLMDGLRERMRGNVNSGRVVLASGISVFDDKSDKFVSQIFQRADALMYENKRQLKEHL